MLNEVIENTERFIASVPKAKRKKYGQFLRIRPQLSLWLLFSVLTSQNRKLKF